MINLTRAFFYSNQFSITKT